MRPVAGENAAPGAVSLLRRLFFEAYTLVASDMRSRVERTDEDPPKKLPKVERESRVQAIRDRLPGARVTDEREPAPSVVNAFVQMAEDQALSFVAWEKIISAKLEAAGSKTGREWKPNKFGAVTERVTKELPTQEVGQDLLRLEHVMVRRAIAMEAARVLSFELHQLIEAKWFEALEDEPADPERYSRTSVAQVHRADQELFRMLAKTSRGSIARRADGVYPLEAPLREALGSARIQQLLQPLAKSRSGDEKPSAGRGSDPSTVSQLKQILQPLLRGSGDRRGGGDSGGGGSSKGKGRGKERGGKTPRMPKELVGLDFSTAKGEPICFAYNLDGCDKASPGQRCPKGWHCCMRPGCGKPHGQRDHR